MAGPVHAVEAQQVPWRAKPPSPAQEVQFLGDQGRQDMGLGVRESSSELPWDGPSGSMALAVGEQIC